MRESASLRFLYQTALGRSILKILVHPGVSKAGAVLFSSRLSNLWVPSFIEKNGIDMSRFAVPHNGFRSFNDFFTRKLADENISIGRTSIVCPSDGLLTVSPITQSSVFHIKHTQYSLEHLLQDKKLAAEFRGGTAFIFRLTPSHYHRYIYCADGLIVKKQRIDGVLHSVRPICHENVDVFVQNSREYDVIRLGEEISEAEASNKVIQMEVGALLVGKISNHPGRVGDRAHKGSEKGNFEYGGSSIVVLSKKPYALAEAIASRKAVDGEIPVTVGESLIVED